MSARVELYSRPGCHLCEDARAVVTQVCTEAGASWHEVNVDADPALRDRYGDDVPVVTVDGRVMGFWHIDADRLRAALANA